MTTYEQKIYRGEENTQYIGDRGESICISPPESDGKTYVSVSVRGLSSTVWLTPEMSRFIAETLTEINEPQKSITVTRENYVELTSRPQPAELQESDA